MDLAFFKRGFASGLDARLDFALLSATLQAVQAASAVALAESHVEDPASCSDLPLADLLLGAPCWREATVSQRGCFNPSQAKRFGKAVATQMTSPFTLAF